MEVVDMNSFPLLLHYGSLCSRITREQAAIASFDERFNSIGRYVVGQSIRFYSIVLSREGKTAFDPEDIFIELWSELRERNPYYKSELGKYLTFAQRVIANKLSEMLETTHCVQLPANAAEKYKTLARLTELDSRQAERLSALVAANVDHAPIQAGETIESGDARPEQQAIANERRTLSEAAIIRMLSSLTARECLAVGLRYGLWGRKRTNLTTADEAVGLQRGTLSKSFVSARKKMRALCSNSHLDLSWL